MLILAKFESGHSADAIIIDNVVSYICLGDGDYMVTYEEPKQNYDLFDITLKHVTELKEVRL